jgi:hypothetical protein
VDERAGRSHGCGGIDCLAVNLELDLAERERHKADVGVAALEAATPALEIRIRCVEVDLPDNRRTPLRSSFANEATERDLDDQYHHFVRTIWMRLFIFCHQIRFCCLFPLVSDINASFVLISPFRWNTISIPTIDRYSRCYDQNVCGYES